MKKSVSTITKKYLIAHRVAGEALHRLRPNDLPDYGVLHHLAATLLHADLATPGGVLPEDVGPVSDHGGADNQQESLLERAYRDWRTATDTPDSRG